MRLSGIWFVISCKRYLKKPSFLLVLVLLPLVCFFLHRGETVEESRIRIAVCAPDGGNSATDSGELGTLLAERLTDEGTDFLFYFYSCDSEETVRDEVAARRAECGFVIGEDLREKLGEGEARKSILVYCSPSTVLDRLAEEVVFGALAEIYDREIFASYVTVEDSPVQTGRQQAEAVYDKWLTNGSTFHFAYSYRDRLTGETKTEAEDTIYPVRGLAATAVFLTGVYSVMMLEQDERRGLFARLSRSEGLWCRAAAVMAPLALAAISGLTAVWAGGSARSWTQELAVMALYVPSVLCYGFLLMGIFRKPQLIGSLVPFLLAAVMLFCPVFLDVERYIPEIGIVGRLFPPYYYLKVFR